MIWLIFCYRDGRCHCETRGAAAIPGGWLQ